VTIVFDDDGPPEQHEDLKQEIELADKGPFPVARRERNGHLGGRLPYLVV